MATEDAVGSATRHVVKSAKRCSNVCDHVVASSFRN